MTGVVPLSPGDDAEALAVAVDSMKAQLLIVLVNRLGGSIEVPVAEIDGTGSWIIEMSVDQGARTFKFETMRKS